MPPSSRRAPHGDPPSVHEPHELGATDDSLDRMLGWFAQYGDTYRVFAPVRNGWIWVIHHPDDVKRVLVTNHRNVTQGVGIDRIDDLGLASFDDVERLPRTLAAVRESMRLYPPGWLLTRRSIGPDRLGGYAVPPGTDVFISPFVVHRHPAIWDNAAAFDPGRFGAGREEGWHRFAYIPFAAGPRHCIGENLATFEMLLHLNGALRRFELRPVVPGPVALEARINLRPAQDIYMRVETR